MKRIDKAEYEKRLDRINELFTEMANHAVEQSRHRCPYKNRHNQCTAHFACRNQRQPGTPADLLDCASDDRLDYREAWETDPDGYERVRQSLRAAAASRPSRCRKSGIPFLTSSCSR